MSKTKSVKENKKFDNWIYCYLTSIPIIQKFDNTNKKPDDYAVYKVGKTKRTIGERMNEHGDRFVKSLFENKVYDCDTIETDLLNLLKEDKRLKQRKNLTNKNEKKEKGDTGLEYFEGRYIYIKSYLDKIITEEFQCSKPRKMDIEQICPICEKKLANEGGLKVHMTRMHKNKSSPIILPPKVSPIILPPRISPSKVSPPRISPPRVSQPKIPLQYQIRATRQPTYITKTGNSKVLPPRIPLQYQRRATRQPTYITKNENRRAPLYSISEKSNSSSNSNLLEIMKLLKLNDKRKRSNRSSLSRSPNSRSNKKAK